MLLFVDVYRLLSLLPSSIVGLTLAPPARLAQDSCSRRYVPPPACISLNLTPSWRAIVHWAAIAVKTQDGLISFFPVVLGISRANRRLYQTIYIVWFVQDGPKAHEASVAQGTHFLYTSCVLVSSFFFFMSRHTLLHRWIDCMPAQPRIDIKFPRVDTE